MGLILHCGANPATREDVMKSLTPPMTVSCPDHGLMDPAALRCACGRKGRVWQPIPHGMMLDLVVERLRGIGLELQEEAYGLTNDELRFFYYLGFKDEKGSQLVIGGRNAHDKTMSAKLAVGRHVFCCDNLAISGEIVVSHKHTRYIFDKLPGMLDLAMAKLTTVRAHQEVRVKAYRDFELTNAHAHDIIIRAIRTTTIPIRCVRVVADEWYQPSFEDFRERTAWSLFNAFTFSLKGTGALALPERTMELHGLFDVECGVSPMEPIPEVIELGEDDYREQEIL